MRTDARWGYPAWLGLGCLQLLLYRLPGLAHQARPASVSSASVARIKAQRGLPVMEGWLLPPAA